MSPALLWVVVTQVHTNTIASNCMHFTAYKVYFNFKIKI